MHRRYITLFFSLILLLACSEQVPDPKVPFTAPEVTTGDVVAVDDRYALVSGAVFEVSRAEGLLANDYESAEAKLTVSLKDAAPARSADARAGRRV